MEYKFSDLANGLKASEIRELLKLTAQPEIISFAGGLPAPELFPLEELKKVDIAIIDKDGKAAVQYGTTEGYVPLRQHICERMKNHLWSIAGSMKSLLRPGRSRACRSSLRFYQSWRYHAR